VRRRVFGERIFEPFENDVVDRERSENAQLVSLTVFASEGAADGPEI